MVLELAALIIFSWAIRSLFVTEQHKGYLADTLAHLFMTKTQARRHRFNYNFDKTVLKTKLGYPKLQHFIISRFDEKTWLLVGARLIILYDVSAIVMLYAIIHWVYPAPDVAFVMGSPAFWAATLLSCSPILFSVQARLRGLGNARTFSLLQVLAMLLAWYLIGTDNLVLFVPVTLGAMLIIIWSSSFGLQVAIFFAVFMSILTLDPVPFASVIFSLIALFALPVGARQILVHKYQHWVWYFRNLDKGSLGAQRNRLEDFAALPDLLFNNRKRFAALCFTYLTPIIFLYAAPIAPVLLYFQMNGQMTTEIPLISFSIAAFWAGVLTFALISIKRLSFLGEAERYLEYSAPFQSLLFVHMAAQGLLPLIVLPMILLINIALLMGLFRHKNYKQYEERPINKLMTPTVRDLVNYFKQDTETELRILTLPTKSAFFWSFMTFKMRHVLFYQNFMGSKNGFRAMEEEMSHDNWQYPISDLSLLQDRYQINRVLMLKVREKDDAERRATYGLSDDLIAHENDEFILFRLEAS